MKLTGKRAFKDGSVSPPVRRRGLKQVQGVGFELDADVASRAEAWIET